MKVVFLPAAEQDLGELFSYIRNELQNPIAARNVATKLLQRVHSLAAFPEMGAGLDGVDQRLRGYRYLIVDNYLVVRAYILHRPISLITSQLANC